MNEERRLYVGDPLYVKSYFAYGQKVLAVADSTVVSIVDEYKDQVPGKLPSAMTLAEADGNHIVLDLGDDRFAFYAHLKPGSIKTQEVKVGDRVCRGQVLGVVGNSGNTSAPHLHFHVMSSPSTLGSNGLPYLIEDFELLGRAPSTAAFDKAEQEGTPLAIQEVGNPGRHSDELPLDLSVVGFPSRQTMPRQIHIP
jgi:murein DD-endopeptidase MepM/ murein hydrolase activator NlpD